MSRWSAGMWAVAALASHAALGVAQNPGKTQPPIASEVCRLTETSRSHLQRPDGSYLYVEPRFIDLDEGRVFVAGQPTYAWAVDSENRGTLLEDRTFFGAVVRGAMVETVPNPEVEGHIGWVRGMRVAPGHYFFVLEVSPREDGSGTIDFPPPLDSRTLWSADLVEGEWQAVRRMAAPRSGMVSPLSSGSQLLPGAGAGDVVLAVPYTAGNGLEQVLFHKRIAGEWTITSLAPVPNLAVDLRRSGDGDAEMLLRKAELSGNSITETLQLQKAEGGAPRAVASAAPGDSFQQVKWGGGPTTTQAGWRLLTEEGSTAWVWDATDGTRPLLIDPFGVQIFSVSGPEIAPVWLTHSAPDHGEQSLTATRVGSSGVLTASAPYPYMGPLISVSRTEDALLTVGPDAHFDPTSPHVRSLLIDYSFSCS